MTLLKGFTKKYALPLWRWYLAGLLALAATNWITLQIPLLAKDIINGINQHMSDAAFSGMAIAIVGLGVLTILTRTLSRILIFWPGREIERQVKSVYFDRMLHLTEDFYQRFGIGELMSRLSNDVNQLRAFYAFGFLQAANLVFILFFTIWKMFNLHAYLTVAALSPLLLMVFFTRYMTTYMHRISKENQEAIGRLSSKVTEAFVNVHVIKSNVAEQTFLARAGAENDDVYQTNVKSIFLRTAVFPMITALMNLSQVIVLFYGGMEVMAGRLTIGDILAFNVYIAFLGFPLSAFGIIIGLYQRCLASLERVHVIENSKKEETTTGLTNSVTQPPFLLEVRNLSFTYPQSLEPALSQISFQLKAGQRLGVFGSIGSGKSTLFNLLTRLLDPRPGQIFFKGEDILGINPSTLRRSLGYAQQGVHLFSQTVKENLKIGRKSSSDTEVQAAAESAQISKEILKFDDGWETEIGEKGLRLSGGQKQRLALARIFLRKPEVFILDDVLSAVDHDTEARLTKEIHSTKSAVIISSHRPSVLRHCDQILFLENGKIKDAGTYTSLVEKYPILKNQSEAS